MKYLRILVLCAIVAMPTIQSCNKDDYNTSAEQKGAELKKFVAEKSIKTASALTYDFSNSAWRYEIGGKFEISGSFIHVESNYYSLDKLLKYSSLYTDNGWVLLLYFQ